MQIYTYAIKAGIILFPIIAFFMTIPYMVRQYRRYGSVLFFRSLIVYSFVLYLLIAFFLVILPLPKIEYVQNLKTPFVNLEPFRFISEINSYSSLVVNDFSTYLPALKHSVLYTNIFNVLLTVPFGFYLRYYFKRRWWETVILTFLLSLFFEITQLSGLYGIYPRPYRIFDVDDLIVNTFGGLMGFIISPLIIHLFPSRDTLDEKSKEKGIEVSYTRRLIAYFLDITIYSSFIFILILDGVNITFTNYFLGLFLYFISSSLLLKGSTFGKKIVKIKVVCNDLKFHIANIYIRYATRYIVFLVLFDVIYYIYNNDYFNSITSIIILFLLLVETILIINSIYSVSVNKRLVYEKFSKTFVISTINVEIIKKSNKKIDNEKEIIN